MSLRVIPLESVDRNYELLISALGYETRSVFAATNLDVDSTVFFVYPRQSTNVFRINESVAKSLPGSTLVELRDFASFASEIASILASVSAQSRIALDISSFDRRRLAVALEQTHQFMSRNPSALVDIIYTPAEYTPPPPHLSHSPLEAGPIGESFHGHLRRTSLPLAAVFGLGYEPQRAIGAYELLEPSRSWAFWPDSSDEQYESSLRQANRLLLSTFPAQDILTYPVLQPGEIYYRLESLVSRLAATSRVVLVPMGPKIFAAVCILLGLADSPERPAVWRIGESGPSQPVDVKPRGMIVGLRLATYS